MGHNPAPVYTWIKTRAKNKKIVFVSGIFNIIHPGHLRLMRFAAECGEYLVVGIHGNNCLTGAFLDETLRIEGIKAITWVDYAFILDTSADNFIKELKPDIVVKGKEHEDHYNPEADIVESYGGKLIFSSGDMTFSLGELLQDESERIRLPIIKKENDFMLRHSFGQNDLIKIIANFKQLKTIVLGEIIVDEYISCDPVGMSREEPCIVVTPVTRKKYIGGAGIVAAHAKSLGADVSFLSIVGEDTTANFVRSKLDEYGVKHFIYNDESRPTILKQKFRSDGKSLLRVNHLRHHPISKPLQKRITNQFNKMLDSTDLVIFSDFNYGGLPTPMIQTIIKTCQKKDILMMADSQSSSQIGDVSRFTNMKLLTPTEREARLAVRDFESGLVVLAEKLRKKSKAENIFITLNKEGMLIHAGQSGTSQWLTDRISAMNIAPQDPSGAGDSLLITSGLAMASGTDIWQAAYLGSLAAACQVERTGNIPLTPADMIRKLSR
ncbi:PfkB family carbohydrate kinase [Desulfobacter latus]|uniref:Adenylyltransferase/cytidyltransferase family protein n=1 Tax=Desulfobacter latus TaxID=2292 RepID=A0A850T9T3_9BACT|nr:PfkB family carbohydrate kinase [Desulfobacter latus]NWH04967.1 adenylyltransferase/cytidyltransferase family protein [Desulfobacter latus]